MCHSEQGIPEEVFLILPVRPNGQVPAVAKAAWNRLFFARDDAESSCRALNVGATLPPAYAVFRAEVRVVERVEG